MRRLKPSRIIPLSACAAALVVFGASAAYATVIVDDFVTVGTSFTRQPHEVSCFASGGCDANWFFQTTNNCGTHAYERLRLQRDALPDVTERHADNFSGCVLMVWSGFHQSFNQSDHQDGKVVSGTATMEFSTED